MLEAAIAICVPLAVSLPHAMPLHRIAPATASAVWVLALWLRALVTVAAAIFFFVYLPQTPLFSEIADWCLHNIVPIISVHHGLSGHPLAHFASVLPGLVLAASVLWTVAGIARAWVALRFDLARRYVGLGPHGTTVIDDDQVVVAVTRFGHGRIIVSHAALGLLDRQELEASLAHELGHLRLRHRPLLIFAGLLAALARPLPGTRAAHGALVFNLERHADEYAVARTRNPLALASALAKAAVPAPAGTAGLGGSGGVALRMTYLADGGRRRSARPVEWLAHAACAFLAILVVGLSTTLPAWGLAAPAKAAATSVAADECHH